MEFLVFHLNKLSLNISFLCNNCLTDHFISNQNLLFAGMQILLLLEFHKLVLSKDIQLLVTKIFFFLFLETQNLSFLEVLCNDESQYQSFL